MSDNLTPEQRSYCMSHVKNRDTDIERAVRSELHKQGLRFRKHIKELPGRPDVVFPRVKVAVFVHGDFWHGYRFPAWRHKVSEFWQEKIAKNRRRDSRTSLKLRRMGWRVLRLWQHEIERDLDGCIARVVRAVHEAKGASESSDKLDGKLRPFVPLPVDTLVTPSYLTYRIDLPRFPVFSRDLPA